MAFYPRTTPIAVSEASDEIWNGKSQFGPLNMRAIDTSFFRSSKARSHLFFQIKSTLLVSAYKGAAI